MIPERLTGALANVVMSPSYSKPLSLSGPYVRKPAANRFEWEIVCVLIISLIKITRYGVSAPSPSPLLTGLRQYSMQSFRFEWDGIRALYSLWVVLIYTRSGNPSTGISIEPL